MNERTMTEKNTSEKKMLWCWGGERLDCGALRGKANGRDQQCLVAENPFSEDSDKYLPQ